LTVQHCSTTPQRIEISTGPPNYIRPAFPKHCTTSPVPLKELLPNDLKNIFNSDLEGDDDVEVIDMLPARLSMTAQPPNDIVISETEPESNEEVTIVCIQPAAGPSCPSTVLPPKDLSLTEPESDEDTIVSLTHLITIELSLISNRQSRWMQDRRLGSHIPSGSTSWVVLLDVVRH